MGKSSKLGILIRKPRKGILLVCVGGRHETDWEETKHWPSVESTCERRWFGRSDIIPWPRLFGLYSKITSDKQSIVDNYRSMFESRISAWAIEKLQCTGKPDANISSWSYDMNGHAKKYVERYYELTNKTTQQLYKVATPCIDDHQFKEEEMGSVGELSRVCSQIVLRYLYLARIGRPDILWSVNKLARAITKWTRVCDKRLARLISYIHHTCEFKQYCHVGNTAQQCSLGLFQESDLAGDLEDSKSTSDKFCVIFGSHMFVPTSWMCKKQTSVPHSSFYRSWNNFSRYSFTRGWNSSSWSLGFGYRSISFFSQSPLDNTRDQVLGNLSRDTTSNKHIQNRTKVPTQHDNFDLINVDCAVEREVFSIWCDAVHHWGKWSRDWSSKAEVQEWDMCPEPTELLLIGCLTELIWTPEIHIKYVGTKHQLANILTKWISHAMSGSVFFVCFNISHFSSLCCAQNFSLTRCTRTMAKRMQE